MSFISFHPKFSSLWMLLLPFALCASPVKVQSTGAQNLKSGKEIFEAGCSGCHGGDGKGAPQSVVGFEKPESFPEFTKCDQTTPEDNLAWKSVITNGGESRGFSQIMPSFSGALTERQIDAVIKYMRGFCTEKGWPRGELNLPRAIATEKAFPENEDIISTGVNVSGAPGITTDIIHEQTFGIHNQIEVTVPVDFTRPERGLWYGGFGDIGIGLKRVIFSSLRAGNIFSVQGEAIIPTGNMAHGLGAGVTTFETFAAFDQLLPHYFFTQFQAGADLPVDTSKSPDHLFFRAAAGKGFAARNGLGRLWSPMVEFMAARDLNVGKSTDWDVMPEMQITLSRRQHIRMAAGVQIPVTNTEGRSKQLRVYILWDRADGKLTEGW